MKNIEAKKFILMGFILVNINLILQPLFGVLALILNEEYSVLSLVDIFTLANHILFTIIAFAPLVFIVKIPNYVFLELEIKHKSAFIMIGLCVFLIYSGITEGVLNWLFYPRQSYENTRVGLIWLWSFVFTLYSLFFCALLFECKTKISILVTLIIGSIFLYFSGSKYFVLSFLLFVFVYTISSTKSYMLYTIFTAIVAGAVFVYMLSLSFESKVKLSDVASYFDYFKNGSYLIENVWTGRYSPSFLSVYISEFYNYIPRGFGVEKPDVVGQMIYNYDLGIGDPVAGYSPAILRSAVAFVDAGYFYPLFYFLFDLRFILVFLLIISCSRELNSRIYIFGSWKIRMFMLLVLFPNFLPFYPIVLQLIFAGVVSSIFFRIKIINLGAHHDLYKPPFLK